MRKYAQSLFPGLTSDQTTTVHHWQLVSALLTDPVGSLGNARPGLAVAFFSGCSIDPPVPGSAIAPGAGREIDYLYEDKSRLWALMSTAGELSGLAGRSNKSSP